MEGERCIEHCTTDSSKLHVGPSSALVKEEEGICTEDFLLVNLGHDAVVHAIPSAAEAYERDIVAAVEASLVYVNTTDQYGFAMCQVCFNGVATWCSMTP